MGHGIPRPGGQKLGSRDLQPGTPHPTLLTRPSSLFHVPGLQHLPKEPLGQGAAAGSPKRVTGPPDPSLDGPRAAVVIHCRKRTITQEQLSPYSDGRAHSPPRQPQVCNPSRLLASLGHWGLAHSGEGHPPISRALPSQPLVVTSAKGLSQRSHWRPMAAWLAWTLALLQGHRLKGQRARGVAVT